MGNRKKENRLIFYLLSFTWGIVWTLIGLLALPIILLIFRRDYEIRIIRGRIFVGVENRNFGGISLGLVVVVDRFTEQLIDHEIGHTIQNAWFGPFFIFLVAIPSGIRYQLWDRIRKRHFKRYGSYPNYYGIWFERQASKLGEKYE